MGQKFQQLQACICSATIHISATAGMIWLKGEDMLWVNKKIMAAEFG
jgi:hypothetical protein